MSRMNELVLQIQDLYVNGYDTEVIALMCEVPTSWVIEALALNEDPDLADCLAFDEGKELAKCI
jgi:hypothetical protein